MLQYITNTECSVPVVDQVHAVLKGGCRWIQLRMKDASDEEIAEVYEAIKPACAEHEAFIVINDRVALARLLEASGVHVGKTDMAPSQARVELGPGAIVGVTANTIEDVLAVQALDIDYIGIGPFADTTTKKNLAPLLGTDGLKAICLGMEERGIETARVAVGGITLDNAIQALEAGANGVAVSGAIARADDIEAQTRRFVDLLNQYLHQ